MRFFLFICCCMVVSGFVPAQTPSSPVTPAAAAQTESSAEKEGILSDTQGVDFKDYTQRAFRITQSSWKPLMPKEVEAPVFKTGEVRIRFKIEPSGHLVDGGVVLEGRSGDSALDRAAWGAVITSVYPPLPAEFKGPYLEMRFFFMYNVGRKPMTKRNLPKPLHVPQPPSLPELVGILRHDGVEK